MSRAVTDRAQPSMCARVVLITMLHMSNRRLVVEVAKTIRVGCINTQQPQAVECCVMATPDNVPSYMRLADPEVAAIRRFDGLQSIDRIPQTMMVALIDNRGGARALLAKEAVAGIVCACLTTVAWVKG